MQVENTKKRSSHAKIVSYFSQSGLASSPSTEPLVSRLPDTFTDAIGNTVEVTIARHNASISHQLVTSYFPRTQSLNRFLTYPMVFYGALSSTYTERASISPLAWLWQAQVNRGLV